MAKVSSVERNKKRTLLVAKYASKRNTLKNMASDKSLSMEERFSARLKLAKLPRNPAANRVRNRCVVSGRPRGFYRKLGISRIALRDLTAQGQIPGMVKSSW